MKSMLSLGNALGHCASKQCGEKRADLDLDECWHTALCCVIKKENRLGCSHLNTACLYLDKHALHLLHRSKLLGFSAGRSDPLPTPHKQGIQHVATIRKQACTILHYSPPLFQYTYLLVSPYLPSMSLLQVCH